MRSPLISLAVAAALSLALAGCEKGDQQAIRVIRIGDKDQPASSNLLAGPTAPLLRAATSEGLVALDGEGKIAPALAERWIVTDDGQSYIFRLGARRWPDGTAINSEAVRSALLAALARQRGTALALDLQVIDEVRAMAGRVVEIRLRWPMPDFLQLLAQPELGLTRGGQGAGPMTLTHEEQLAWLTVIPPEKRGGPPDDEAAPPPRPVTLAIRPIAMALASMTEGKADLVLGGSFRDFANLRPNALSAKQPRIDPVSGLFGLLVENTRGVLATASNREAIAMAIDRAALASRLNLPGWGTTTRLVPPGLEGDAGRTGERWVDADIATRRMMATTRIAAWSKAHGQPSPLRIALPAGPGADRLAEQLAGDLALIGLTTERVASGAPADLRLLDEVARYPAPAWFFNQLACAVREPCEPKADQLAAAARGSSPALAPALYAQAETAMLDANFYVPLGVPFRWSLAPPDLPGFFPNRWAYHPLYPLTNRAK